MKRPCSRLTRLLSKVVINSTIAQNIKKYRMFQEKFAPPKLKQVNFD